MSATGIAVDVAKSVFDVALANKLARIAWALWTTRHSLRRTLPAGLHPATRPGVIAPHPNTAPSMTR